MKLISGDELNRFPVGTVFIKYNERKKVGDRHYIDANFADQLEVISWSNYRL